jgi:hypothetical protein
MSGTTGARGTAPATDETVDLIASNKVDGTAVYSPSEERLGSVYNLMIHKRSGQVAYAVMSFGGFLGMGSNYHPLPWNQLTYNTRLGGYVVNLTKEQLEGAPTYAESEADVWNDPAYGRRVDDYYGGLGPV